MLNNEDSENLRRNSLNHRVETAIFRFAKLVLPIASFGKWLERQLWVF